MSSTGVWQLPCPPASQGWSWVGLATSEFQISSSLDLYHITSILGTCLGVAAALCGQNLHSIEIWPRAEDRKSPRRQHQPRCLKVEAWSPAPAFYNPDSADFIPTVCPYRSSTFTNMNHLRLNQVNDLSPFWFCLLRSLPCPQSLEQCWV